MVFHLLAYIDMPTGITSGTGIILEPKRNNRTISPSAPNGLSSFKLHTIHTKFSVVDLLSRRRRYFVKTIKYQKFIRMYSLQVTQKLKLS